MECLSLSRQSPNLKDLFTLCAKGFPPGPPPNPFHNVLGTIPVLWARASTPTNCATACVYNSAEYVDKQRDSCNSLHIWMQRSENIWWNKGRCSRCCKVAISGCIIGQLRGELGSWPRFTLILPFQDCQHHDNPSYTINCALQVSWCVSPT